MGVMYAEQLQGEYGSNRFPAPGPAGIDHEIIVARLVALFDTVSTEKATVGRLANMMAVGVLELRRRCQATDAVQLRSWEKDALFRSILAAYHRLGDVLGTRYSPQELQIAVRYCIGLIKFWASGDARRAARGAALEDLNLVALSFQICLLNIALCEDMLQRASAQDKHHAEILGPLLTPVADEAPNQSAGESSGH